MKRFGLTPWNGRGAVLMAVISVAIFLGWVAILSAAQLPGPGSTGLVEDTRVSDIHDVAGQFGAEAVAAARQELRRFESKTSVPTFIVTLKSLEGRSIETEGESVAKKSGIEGIFVVIGKTEKKIQVQVSPRYLGKTMTRQRDVIRKAFIDEFHDSRFDQGLKRGVAAIGESLVRGSGLASFHREAGDRRGSRAKGRFRTCGEALRRSRPAEPGAAYPVWGEGGDRRRKGKGAIAQAEGQRGSRR